MWSRGWEPKASPGSSLERPTPRPRLGLLGWALHFNKTPRRFVCTLTSETHCWRGSHSVRLADFTPLWCHLVCSSTFCISSTLRVGSVSFIRVSSDFFFWKDSFTGGHVFANPEALGVWVSLVSWDVSCCVINA